MFFTSFHQKFYIYDLYPVGKVPSHNHALTPKKLERKKHNPGCLAIYASKNHCIKYWVFCQALFLNIFIFFLHVLSSLPRSPDVVLEQAIFMPTTVLSRLKQIRLPPDHDPGIVGHGQEIRPNQDQKPQTILPELLVLVHNQNLLEEGIDGLHQF